MAKGVEAQLEQIRRVAQARRSGERRGRGDDGDKRTGLAYFEFLPVISRLQTRLFRWHEAADRGLCCGPLTRILRQHPLNIFRDDVELDIHDVVRLKAFEIRLPARVRNDPDGEACRKHFCDR